MLWGDVNQLAALTEQILCGPQPALPGAPLSPPALGAREPTLSGAQCPCPTLISWVRGQGPVTLA